MTEYDEDGFVRNFPQLLQQRRLHGCSYYDNANGTKEFIDNICDCALIIELNTADLPSNWREDPGPSGNVLN